MIKYILTWLFIFVVGSLIVSFLIAPSSFQSFKQNMREIIPDKLEGFQGEKEDSLSIKELTQNMGDYLGKEVSVRGKLDSDGWGKFLEEKDYWIYINKRDCIEGHRNYHEGSYYRAEGIVTEQSGLGYNYYEIVCDQYLI